MRATVLSRSALAAIAATLLSLPAMAAQPSTTHAVWVPRHISFTYEGITTHYSCDGLRDRVVHMLRKLGARDLKVRETGCMRGFGPETFPGLKVKMKVLVPAHEASGGSRRVAAHWHKVRLMSALSNMDQAGECELAQQFRHAFLPAFEARHIVLQGTPCVPNRVEIGTYLSAEVLVADRSASRTG